VDCNKFLSNVILFFPSWSWRLAIWRRTGLSWFYTVNN